MKDQIAVSRLKQGDLGGLEVLVSHYQVQAVHAAYMILYDRSLAWLDSLAQLTGDWWQLAPSVFTLNHARGESSVAENGAFFQCPQCGTSLEDTPEMLICSECSTKYAVRNGIYDFREPVE